MITAADIQTELAKGATSKRGLFANLAVLLISLVLFFSLGLIDASPRSMVLLVTVLFIHEAGHYVGMRVFGYRDVRMFFIPLFGAAVSGVETRPGAAKQAIVALLGPVPGMLIGLVFAFQFLRTQDEFAKEAAQMFLLLNGLNMLPLLPFDGGHVLEALFLVRRPKLEVAIRLLAVLGLGALALLLKSGAFGLLTFLQIGSLRASYTVAHRAAEFGRELESSGATPDMNAIPPEYLERMTPDLWSIAKNSVNPARLAASWARVVWRKACQRRPGVPATVALSLLYFLMLAIGLVSPFAMAVLDQGAQLDVTIEDRASPLGSMIPVEIRRAQGVKVLECPLDAQGFYDGISYERAAVTGAPLVVTGWRQGVLHGDRRTIDSNSNIVSVLSYDSGRVTQFLQRVGGVLTMVPEAEWPRGLSGAQAEPVRSPVFEVYTTTVARVGQPCPAFQATAVDGTSVNSADFSGSVVWVNLLAMSNAVCVLEARALAKDIMPRLAGKNIRLVVVMRDCAPEDAKRYAAETGLTCPVLPDPDRAIYRQFALGYVPRNVLIGPDGTILQHHTGYRLADLDTVASEALRLANR